MPVLVALSFTVPVIFPVPCPDAIGINVRSSRKRRNMVYEEHL
jgi:hypothetical protein